MRKLICIAILMAAAYCGPALAEDNDTAAILRLMNDRVARLESTTASLDSRLSALESRLTPPMATTTQTVSYATVCSNGSCSLVPTVSAVGPDGYTVYDVGNSPSPARRRLFTRWAARRAGCGG